MRQSFFAFTFDGSVELRRTMYDDDKVISRDTVMTLSPQEAARLVAALASALARAAQQ